MNKHLTHTLSFLIGLMCVALSAHAQDKRPNILFINTDDQRPDSLQCFNLATTGKPESALGYVLSPNVDQLAAQGTMFTQAYCQAPICGPSRASFNRGAYNHSVGNYGYESGHNGNDNYIPMIGERLSEMGYYTAMFGKGEHSTKQYPKKNYNKGLDTYIEQPFHHNTQVWVKGRAHPQAEPTERTRP
jgi:arylsulfatase A-like enzyme